MKISIAIPFHLKGKEQNECYRRTFSHYASLPYTVHLCGSEGDLSRSFCEPFLSDNVKYFEVEQGEVCLSSNGSDVLRDKFNDSLKTLPESDWYAGQSSGRHDHRIAHQQPGRYLPVQLG